MTRVLHILPEGAFANTYHGCYKDVMSRIRFLEQPPFSYNRVTLPADDPQPVIREIAVNAPTHVFIEYSIFPRVVSAIRNACPSAWIGVRAHNIEPLQHLDSYGWWSSRGPLWMLYGMTRLLSQDARIKRSADAVLPISDWEAKAYWNRLPGRALVQWLPYVCPQHLVPAHATPIADRKIVACLPTSQKNRKSWDLVTRFMTMASTMKSMGAPWEFVVTGRLDAWSLPPCPDVSFVGFVEDLSSFLGQCRAVSMLSPLGYGFKTTLADAWAAGAHALAHPRLIARSPATTRSAMIPVDTHRKDSMASALRQLQGAPAGLELHRRLVMQFDHTMNALFAN